MKLYVGSRNYKPEGFHTVDIDLSMNPDIHADITKRLPLDDGVADELVAGHVLEHLEWPDSFFTLAEFARVLKVGGSVQVAIPDLDLLLRMLHRGDNAFHVAGLLYGVGARYNVWEKHRYGFTQGMMISILETLGFSDFDWWNSDIPDASNGWVPQPEAEPVALSLNIRATKVAEPAVDTERLFQRLCERPLSDFLAVAGEVLAEADGINPNAANPPKIYQRVHYRLIEARQRIRFLEQELEKAVAASSNT